MIKCLAQGHKCHGRDSNPHSAKKKKKKDLKKYPVSLTHFPSLDRPVTGGTFNQRSTIATTLFVNLTNTGNSQQRTNPILYEKYNLKIKSTKM